MSPEETETINGETLMLDTAQLRAKDARPEHDDANPVVPENEDEEAVDADPFLRKLHFELRKDQDTGRWNWVLWAPNHRAIAVNARSYSRRNDAERAVRRMREGADNARVVIATM